jgi:hypothetical protein
MVGAVGFEPTTPSASRKCSPPELSARDVALETPRRSAARGIVSSRRERARPRCSGRSKPVSDPGEPRRALCGSRLRPPPPVGILPLALCACGRGSGGRAHPCQGWGRGFDSRRPLHRSSRRGLGPEGAIPRTGLRSLTPPVRAQGDVAKWQGRGLQSLYPRFESGRRLQETHKDPSHGRVLSYAREHGRANERARRPRVVEP